MKILNSNNYEKCVLINEISFALQMESVWVSGKPE